ncbi:MAG: hypothetical protein Q8Q06_01095 [bacterium]|nr:hypothetical protein [bacterium]
MASTFLISLAVNLVWEHAHAFLYLRTSYLTNQWYTLPGAAILDAIYVTAIIFIFRKKPVWVKALIAVLLSVFMELLALKFNWWGYRNLMPTVPYLNIGLSPLIQLGATVYIVQYLRAGALKSPSASKS